MVTDDREPHEIAGDAIVIQTLWLIKNGVPFDIAWSLPAHQAKAWTIILAGFENGREFDWKNNCWKDPPK